MADSKKKIVRRRPGSFVAIPISDVLYGYARILDKLMAFYSLNSEKIEDVDSVINSPIAFIAPVQFSAVKDGRWPIIGHRPLEERFTKDVKFFRVNPSGNGFLIYVSKPKPPHAYEEYEADVSDCVGLDPLIAWDPNSIEDRLRDYVNGRENQNVERYLSSIRKNIRTS